VVGLQVPWPEQFSEHIGVSQLVPFHPIPHCTVHVPDGGVKRRANPESPSVEQLPPCGGADVGGAVGVPPRAPPSTTSG